eukprot:20-Pelagococcus_subviridis.AAC.2
MTVVVTRTFSSLNKTRTTRNATTTAPRASRDVVREDDLRPPAAVAAPARDRALVAPHAAGAARRVRRRRVQLGEKKPRLRAALVALD